MGKAKGRSPDRATEKLDGEQSQYGVKVRVRHSFGLQKEARSPHSQNRWENERLQSSALANNITDCPQ